MAKKQPRIIDLAKERYIAAIVIVLRGMETDYVENVLEAMVRERDGAIEMLRRKAEILNYVRWGYGG